MDRIKSALKSIKKTSFTVSFIAIICSTIFLLSFILTSLNESLCLRPSIIIPQCILSFSWIQNMKYINDKYILIQSFNFYRLHSIITSLSSLESYLYSRWILPSFIQHANTHSSRTIVRTSTRLFPIRILIINVNLS